MLPIAPTRLVPFRSVHTSSLETGPDRTGPGFGVVLSRLIPDNMQCGSLRKSSL